MIGLAGLGKIGLTERVECRFGRVDDDIRDLQFAQLEQLRVRIGGLQRTAPSGDYDVADRRLRELLNRMITRVGRGQLLGCQHEHARDVDGDIAVADHNGTINLEVWVEVVEIGVPVVPGNECGGWNRTNEVFAWNAHATVGLCSIGVDDGVVVLHQLCVRDVAANLDIAEHPKARLGSDLLEHFRDGLDLRMVGSDAGTHQPPWGRQTIKQVDLNRGLGIKQVSGGVEASRTGTNHGNAGRTSWHTSKVACTSSGRGVY